MKALTIEMTEVMIVDPDIQRRNNALLILILNDTYCLISTAIRVAVKWYANHLSNGKKKAPITVVMLSDDRDNREKAKSAAIKCSSVRDYVADLTDSPELVDMVVSAKDASEAQAKADGKIEYEEVSSAFAYKYCI
jgi:hypothetical protein